MVLAPRHCTTRASTAGGVGDKNLAKMRTDEISEPREALANFLRHLYACGHLPLVANKSRAFLQPKSNGKKGLLSQRMLHLFCSFWKGHFGVALYGEMKKQTTVAKLHARLP